MVIACPYCGQENDLDDEILGGEMRCKACNRVLVISPLKPPESQRLPTSPSCENFPLPPPSPTP